jgi:hypothetical protein
MTDIRVQPRVWTSPTPAPIRGTLLDIVPVIADIGSQDGIGLFESYNCLDTGTAAVAPCPASFLSAPTQASSSTATTGGTLAAGTYRAVITATNARGETVKSNEISQVTTGSTSTITWNWNNLSGETGYKIYVTAVGGASGTETFLIARPADTTSYVWTGSVSPDGTTAPPSANTAVVSVAKTFGSPSWQDGFKFATYTGVICKAVGFDREHAVAELERVFTNMESQAVAQALMTNRFVDGGTLNWDAATDLTPAGGAVDPSVGLAILEGDAGKNYAGTPIIHSPRTVGSLLTRNGQASLNGDVLVSSLGTPIAADAGYDNNIGPTGAAPAAGELWMYASGQVSLAASQPFSQWGLDLVEAGDSNRIRILRERAYLAAVDCYTAAVRVKVQ